MDTATKVLIVDDNQAICEVMNMQVPAKGYEVLMVNSGKDAIASVRDNKPQVMFLDKHMPEMDGIEALRLIRQFNKSIKVIMISADELDEKTERSIKELNVYVYLRKPFDIHKIGDVIKGLEGQGGE